MPARAITLVLLTGTSLLLAGCELPVMGAALLDDSVTLESMQKSSERMVGTTACDRADASDRLGSR